MLNSFLKGYYKINGDNKEEKPKKFVVGFLSVKGTLELSFQLRFYLRVHKVCGFYTYVMIFARNCFRD